MFDPSDDWPRGLVFPGLQDEARRGPLLVLLSVVLLAGGALVWPVYPAFGHVRPYVLGLPFSFAWVVGWLLIVFVALVLFYRVDESGPAD